MTALAKLAGCCTKCDKEVFEIVARDRETRAPTKFGPPLEDAWRLTFVLGDGTRMDLTFCKCCSDGIEVADYPHIWEKVMAGWIAQSSVEHPNTRKQRDNTIFALLLKKPWSEVRTS